MRRACTPEPPSAASHGTSPARRPKSTPSAARGARVRAPLKAGLGRLSYWRPGAGVTAMADGSFDHGELSEGAARVAGQLRRPALAPLWVACAAMGLDLPALSVALWFAQYAAAGPGFSPGAAALLAVALAAATTALLAATKGYRPGRLRAFRAALLHAGLAAAPAWAALVWAGGWGAAAPAALALAAVLVPLRAAFAAALGWALETGLVQRRAILAGGGAAAAELIRGLAARSDNDVQLHGLFDDRDDERSPPQILGVPKLGDYDDLVTFVRRAEIDMVIVTLPLTAEARINWLLERLRVLPVDLRLSAFSGDYAFREEGRAPLLSAAAPSFAPSRRLTKRVFDTTLAAGAIVVLSPLMVAAALAVRLDSPGPVIFRQRRHGYNDRVIEVWKFRTLRHEDADPDARRVVTRDDDRVTRVGRLLRRSSIDELPQLFNVLAGRLSLVGPRPHALDARSSEAEPFERMVEGYSARHRLPPGITGWAQIHGLRGEVDRPEALRARFAHDLYYIENWSLWLDLRILVRTPLSLLKGTGAY